MGSWVGSLLLICGHAWAAAPAVVTGPARVFDGDTLEVQGRRIRLHGIDAPEGDQRCVDASGGTYRCGDRARAALAGRVRGEPVRCERRDRDEHGRIVAVCFLGDENLNAWLVRHGWALAYLRYSRDYVGEERAAREAGVGMWAGSFEKPWEHRRAARMRARTARPPAETAAGAGGCCIKGNINGQGERIYHVPGQRHYAATQISESRGERYFCSEAEAQAAGWRRAR